MFRLGQWAVLALAVVCGLGTAQGEKKAEPKKETGRTNEVMVLYHDGTRVKTLLMQDSIDVTTRFGKLTVPTTEVRRIEFGFRLADETNRKLEQALRNLGSNNFQERETASKDLIALGRLAYPALMKASKGGDLETTKRIEEVLKVVKEKVPADQLRTRVDDLVFTGDFTIAGKIESATIKAKTEHFGEVQLKVADLRNLLSTGNVGELKVAIDAATYGTQANQWLDTGYMANPDNPLLITATGEVDLYGNQQPGQYITGPEGNRNVGRVGMYVPGQLLGRIGEDGPVFVVGKKYEGSPTTEGKLYLRIVPLQGSGGSTGTFQVKVSAGGT